MSKIYLIGIDGSGTLKQRRDILERCGLIVASKRLAALLGNTFVPIQPITPIEEAFEQIEEGLEGGNICVLASGDPLFYGIGGRLVERFGRDKVIVFPALSSLQEAFARFKISWDDAHIVSLHGRKNIHLPGLLLNHNKTFAFTDPSHSPDRIAGELRTYLENIGAQKVIEELTMYVAENLGSPEEIITTGQLSEIEDHTFGKLNVICISLPISSRQTPFGLTIDEIAHSRGLITKDEVRAVTLHKLRLPKQGVFWDIGGGSGSISLEAAAMNPQLTVYTVEHRKEELDNIKKNIRNFSRYNIVPVEGRAAGKIGQLPTPDSVFIGGSDGEMEDIIAVTSKTLVQQGRLVINGVTKKTVSEAPQLMMKHGFAVSSSTISVSRNSPEGPVNFNPITIIVGVK